ncbi:hypothetical protein HU200_057156 [Digitaria exilis]|uniref:BTB domain-containing protein n=1 Tax=Digitaria exilis TaxID=1010633 RepID=A0A835E4H8_9POAL|nr:hypothetical protein HU200_057156 [Digitaria exilis]
MCVVDGYKWEIRFSYPYEVDYDDHRIELVLVSLGDGKNGVRAAMSCRLVDPSDTVEPSPAKTSTASFRRAIIAEPGRARRPAPGKQGGERRHTFAVSGETFAAHKNVLAARSPVFKAEFFGGMVEKSSVHVEIKEMEPSVFAAMLRFLCTDAVQELEKMTETMTVALARGLLVAADRYGLDRLKVMCEHRLAFAIDTSTAATTLALAERHGCEQLKAKCVEFIA